MITSNAELLMRYAVRFRLKTVNAEGEAAEKEHEIWTFFREVLVELPFCEVHSVGRAVVRVKGLEEQGHCFCR